MSKKCPIAESCSLTKTSLYKTSHLWTIENFIHLTQKTGEFIESSIFGSDSDLKWCLNLYPNGDKVGKEEFVGIFVCMKESNVEELSANYKLAVIDDKQKIFKENKFKQSLKKGGQDWGYNEFIKRSVLEDPNKNLLPNDKLTIYCEITFSGNCVTTSTQKSNIKRRFKTLMDNIKVMFENISDCDVEIVVSGHKFNAHKVILMARSPVFAAMFRNPMKESQQNRVEIHDINDEVFGKLLRFIYKDKVSKEKEIKSNIELFMAANKYKLDALKSICEEYISSQLSVETVSEVLILADNHSSKELKDKAIDFIKINSIQVMKTKGWVKVMQNSAFGPLLKEL